MIAGGRLGAAQPGGGVLENLARPQPGRSMRVSSTMRVGESRRGEHPRLNPQAPPRGDRSEESNFDNFRVPPGKTHVLMDVKGPGVITHIWMTFLGPEPHPWAPRGSANHQEMLLRIYWDGRSRPGVEAPVGDFFANCFGKRSMLDAAARVPMIVRYPKRFARGHICETPVSLVDIMPTILAAAGIDPGNYNPDGVDLAEAVGYDDRTIYSQYQRGPLGVYMILNRRWKYFYSAPDRREFLFDRIHDPEETRNRAGLSLCRREQEEMRGELIGFYKEQGYTEPIEGDRWKLFPQPSIPVNPDAGLLIQDPGWSLRYQRIPGYTD